METNIFCIILFALVFYLLIKNNYENFCTKEIKPFGYGYRPYYGYNTYLYTNANASGYSRPLYIPVENYNYLRDGERRTFSFKMYGMY